MATARKGDLVIVHHVSTYSSIYGGGGLHQRVTLERAAATTRDGVVTKIDNPGGKPLPIQKRFDTVYVLPPLRPGVSELLGETWSDLEEAKRALRPFQLPK